MAPARPTLRQLAVLAAGLALGLALLSWRAQDLVLYNHSPSIPVGLYLRIDGPITRGSIVTVRARDVAGEYSALRGFDDVGDRFIKRVGAMAGDHICTTNASVTLNHIELPPRRETDHSGRRLPRWSQCRVLEQDELFLLGDTEESFDSRYWGPVTRSQIDGVWRKL